MRGTEGIKDPYNHKKCWENWSKDKKIEGVLVMLSYDFPCKNLLTF